MFIIQRKVGSPALPILMKSFELLRRKVLPSAQQRMMANPYTCEVQLDELSPDHAIIDFAFISEENFALVVLLASNGEFLKSHYFFRFCPFYMPPMMRFMVAFSPSVKSLQHAHFGG